MRSFGLAACAASVVFALLLAGCGAGGHAAATGPASPPLLVVDVTPANGADTPADAVTLVFSEAVDPDSVFDSANEVDGLSADIGLFDGAGERVPGTARLDDETGTVLRIEPAVALLPAGQYTVVVRRDVRSAAGGELQGGTEDFFSAFTVGGDSWPPVVRDSFPAPGQQGVAKDSTIVVRFNESLDPATVGATTVVVEDVTESSPVPAAGGISLSEDGFVVRFRPEPVDPLPSNSTIFVRIRGGADGIRDRAGNALAADFEFRFETVKESPPLVGVYTVSPNPAFGRYRSSAVFFGTATDVGALDEAGYLDGNDPADLGRWGDGYPVPYSVTTPTVAGRTGSLGEILVDPRFHPVTGHSWYYVVDRGNRAVHVLATRICRVIHTWTRLPDPAGLARSPDGSTLWVANADAGTVSALALGDDPAGTLGVADAMKAADRPDRWTDIDVGRGPEGIAHEPGGRWLLAANRLDDTVSVIDAPARKVAQTLPVGDEPVEIAVTKEDPELGAFAFVANRGGNSVTVLWRRGPAAGGPADADAPWEAVATATGFAAPADVGWDGVRGAWIANAGGRTIAHLVLDVTGAGAATTVVPRIAAEVDVGGAPTSLTVEAWTPYQTAYASPPTCVIVAVPDAGHVVFVDAAMPARPPYSLAIPGARQIATWIDE